MAELKTVVVDDIIVPARLRAVDDDHALFLSADIAANGLINPITVRRTPPATRPFKPFTLIAGAHRLRACVMLDRRDVDCFVVEAGAGEALLLEVSENLIRNELSALDRAVFVIKYREAWEAKHGAIRSGPAIRDKLSPIAGVSILDAVEAMEGSSFFEHAAARLGVHPKSIKRAQQIGSGLSPALRQALRGSPVADNQSQLLKLAAMEPARQKQIAVSFTVDKDISRAIELTDPNAKEKADASQQDGILSRLISTWSRADAKTRAAFLAHIGKTKSTPREKLPTLTELLAATNAGEGGGDAT